MGEDNTVTGGEVELATDANLISTTDPSRVV